MIDCSSGWLDYLLTSLASLAIKNPSVPSCILTWLPGLMMMLGSQRNRHIILISFWTTLSHAHNIANQEECYTHLLKVLIWPILHLSGLHLSVFLCLFFWINTSSLLKFWELDLLCRVVSHVCSSDLGQFADVILTWMDRMYNSMIAHWILILFFTEWYWFALGWARGQSGTSKGTKGRKN